MGIRRTGQRRRRRFRDAVKPKRKLGKRPNKGQTKRKGTKTDGTT